MNRFEKKKNEEKRKKNEILGGKKTAIIYNTKKKTKKIKNHTTPHRASNTAMGQNGKSILALYGTYHMICASQRGIGSVCGMFAAEKSFGECHG